jgi:hypothetical protein
MARTNEANAVCGSRSNMRGLNRAGLLFVLAMTVAMAACGGGASGGSGSNGSLSGNWQFTLAPQAQSGGPTFTGLLQGGFMLQSNGSVTGQAVYSVTALGSQTGPCNAGSATITGTVSGESVTLTVVAGTQTFTLPGTITTSGSTTMLSGIYTSTAGTGVNGSPCGYAETADANLSWSAVSVPPLTGTIQGSFHSTGGVDGLANQDFPVSGNLIQGENIGASNATVTGTLSFTGYPCFSTASVNGTISGDTVILQIIATNGAAAGQIGAPQFSSTGIQPVNFVSTQAGYVLRGATPTYMALTSGCSGTGLDDYSDAGDYGNICLALNSTTGCQEPITLSPASTTFPAQLLGTTPTAQTITLTNISSSAVNGNGLTLSFNPNTNGDGPFQTPTDFDGLPSFTETDACGAGGGPSQGNPFDLGSGQSCSITVTFSPQESCSWLPFGSPPTIAGAPPEYCPFPQQALVTVNCPQCADSDKAFAVPITGTGLSALQASVPELDFGAEQQPGQGGTGGESSPPQMLSFTNYSANPVEIPSSLKPCLNPAKGQNRLPHDGAVGSVDGLQVVSNGAGSLGSIAANGDTINYDCDSDPDTLLPNFQISYDGCSGTVVAPQTSCSLQIAYIPQPGTDVNDGLDYFLELNTVQCWPAGTLPSESNPCEIDAGRFPVELKANSPSPLRMSPAAGLDFGIVPKGTTSAPQTITLLNDPNLATPVTVTFAGKIEVQGNYSETDDCTATLAPGESCTLSVTFQPSSTGFKAGSLTINYSPEPFGVPQFIYLRGTGH